MSESNQNNAFLDFKFLNLVKLEENISLLHDIILEDDFCFTSLPDNCWLKEAEFDYLSGFWSELRSQIDGNFIETSCLQKIIVFIKNKLISLVLNNSTKQKDFINELLDFNHIQQQISNEAFDMRHLSIELLGFIKSICAPVRDPQIHSLQTVEDPIIFLQTIVKLLDDMTIDFANFEVKTIRPLLQVKSIEYENKLFNDLTDKKTDILMRTKFWLYQSIHTGADIKYWFEKLQPQSNRQHNNHLLFIINGFFMLITKSIELPETLIFDCKRIVDLSMSFKRLALSHQISQTINEYLQKTTLTANISGPKQIYDILIENNEIKWLTDQIKHTILLNTLEESEFSHLCQLIFDSMKSVNSGSSEFVVFMKRYLLNIVIGKVIDVFNNQNEFDFEHEDLCESEITQYKTSILSLKEQLLILSNQLIKLINYNYAVYVTYYSRILEDLLKTNNYKESSLDYREFHSFVIRSLSRLLKIL